MRGKRRLHRRILSVLLALMMCANLVPMPAMAAVDALIVEFAGQNLSAADNTIALNSSTSYGTPEALKIQTAYSGSTTGRKVTVQLAGGLDFYSIPGMTRSGNAWTFNAADLPLDMKGVIDSASVTYQQMVMNTYTKAYAPVLTINLADSAVSLNTGEMLKIRPDPDWLWQNPSTYPDAVVVTSTDSSGDTKTEKAETVTMTSSLNSFGVQTITGGFPSADYPSGRNPFFVVAGEENKAAFFFSARYWNGSANLCDFKQMVYTFQVPKALGLTAVNIPSATDTNYFFSRYGTSGSYTIDKSNADYDLVTLTYQNLHLTYDGSYPNTMFELVFTPPTSETVFPYNTNEYFVSSPTVELTLPDGTTQTMNNHIGNETNKSYNYNGVGYNTFQRARPESPLLSAYETTVTLQKTTGYEVGGSTQLLGQFNIQNDTVKNIDNNALTYTFPTSGVVVRSYHMFSRATEITAKLSNGKTYTVPDKSDNAVVTVADILKAAGESDDGSIGIAEISCKLPSVATSERSNMNINSGLDCGTGGGRYYGYTTAQAPDTWTATVKISSPNTTDTKTVNAITKASETQNRRVITYIGDRSFVAGKTYQVRAYAYNDGYTFGTEGDVHDFTLYLREDDYLTYDVDSMVMYWKGNTYKTSDGTLTATKGTDSAGKSYYAVKPTTDTVSLQYFNDQGTAYGVPWGVNDANAARGVILEVKVKADTSEAVSKKNDFFLQGGADPSITFDSRWPTYRVENTYGLGAGKTLSAHTGYNIDIAPSTDFVANTAASIDSSAWQTYSKVEGNEEYTGQLVVSDTQDGAYYQAKLQNNTDKVASGCSLMIPIPKAGENVNDVIDPGNKLYGQFQGTAATDDFGFTLKLDQEITVDGCEVKYCTSYNVDPKSAAWQDWGAIGDKSAIKMVKVTRTTDLNPQQSFTFSFPMSISPSESNSLLTADSSGLKVDTYSAAFQRTLIKEGDQYGTSGIVPTEQVSMVLKLGKINGNVWLDQNKNGVKDAGSDLPYAGATVQLIDKTQSPEAVISTAITDAKGDYAFDALLDADYTVRVVNPNEELYVFVTPGDDSDVTADTGEASAAINTANRTYTVDAGLAASVIKVTLDATTNGGSLPDGTTNPLRGMAGGQITAIPEALAPAGQDFLGWYDQSTGGTLVNLTKFPQADMTLYAQYAPKRTVVYAMNGGNVGGDPADVSWTTLTNNETLGSYVDTLGAIPAPVKDGYTLLGWQTENGEAIILPDKMAQQVITNDTTYTAYWLQNNAEIVFDANGGMFYNPTSGVDSPTQVSYARPDQYQMFLSAASKPTREGYLFAGWAESSSATTPTDKESVTFDSANSPKTYYAVWTPLRYTVTLYYNGGNVNGAETDKVQNIVHGDLVSSVKPVAQPTPPSGSYVFDGWMDIEDPSITLSTAELNQLTVTSDRGFVALWTEAPYTVTFDSGTDGTLGSGGTVETSKYGALDTAKLAVPTVEPETGKVFTGWRVTETNDANASDGLTVDRVMQPEELYEVAVKGDLSFEAVYTAAEIRVIFEPNGGTVSQDSQLRQTIAYQTSPQPVEVIRTDGYALLGWLNTSTGEIVSADKVGTTPLEQDTVYVAQWVQNIYTLTFDSNVANGGTGPTPAPIKNMYGAVYALVETAIPLDNVHNRFIGWYTQPVGGEEVKVWNVKGNLTVYAHYTPVDAYGVTFMQGSGGTLVNNPTIQSVLEGETVTAVPAITTFNSKVFIGWRDDINSGVYDNVAVLAYPVTRDVIFTAQYADDADAIVIFNFDGGRENQLGYALLTGLPGNRYAVPAPTRSGYRFVGWDAAVSNTFGQARSIITYTARWEEEYTVTFLPGTSGTMTPATCQEAVLKGQVVTSVPTATGNTGYAFSTWRDGDGKDYTGAEIVLLPIEKDMTFTAIYSTVSTGGGGSGGGGGGSGTTATKYTLSFSTNGGNVISPVTQTTNTTVSLTGYTPVRSNYTFAGWYLDAALTQAVSSVTLTKNMTVYAKWTPDGLLNTSDHFNYIIGYKDGTFRPNKSITRGEVATIFFRLLTDSTRTNYWATKNTYSDVNSSIWFNNAVSTLSNMGIVQGRKDGQFHGYDAITRAEFAAMAVRFSSQTGETTNTNTVRFTDTTGHWASAYINQAADMGWIQGYADQSFKPNNQITRAEVVTIVNRMLHRDQVTTTSFITGIHMWSDTPVNMWCFVDVEEASNSHEYVWDENNQEQWTSLSSNRDWAALETSWATANSGK